MRVFRQDINSKKISILRVPEETLRKKNVK